MLQIAVTSRHNERPEPFMLAAYRGFEANCDSLHFLSTVQTICESNFRHLKDRFVMHINIWIYRTLNPLSTGVLIASTGPFLDFFDFFPFAFWCP